MNLKHITTTSADAFDRFTAWFFCLRADPTLRSIPLRFLLAAALGVAIGTVVSIVRTATAPGYVLNSIYLSQPGREGFLGEILNRCERDEETQEQCAAAERAVEILRGRSGAGSHSILSP